MSGTASLEEMLEGMWASGKRLSLQKLAQCKTGGAQPPLHPAASHSPVFTPAVLRVWFGDPFGVRRVKTVFIIILRSYLPFHSLTSIRRDFPEATIT